jgi:hypothetical protein
MFFVLIPLLRLSHFLNQFLMLVHVQCLVWGSFMFDMLIRRRQSAKHLPYNLGWLYVLDHTIYNPIPSQLSFLSLAPCFF